MKNGLKFYKCEACKKIVGIVEDSAAKLICCGKEMAELVPNTVDAAKEKHVPALSLHGHTLKVAVGSVAHTMTAEHNIPWIAVAQENRTTRVTLPVNGAPEAEFHVNSGPVTVYAYCNLHGLWAASL